MATTHNQTQYGSGSSGSSGNSGNSGIYISINGNRGNMYHPLFTSRSIQLPTINIVNRNHDYHSTENPIRLSCKNDMLTTGGRNPKINYSIEREKRRSSEYRHRVSSEVKNIATQSVITGPNKLSCNDIYNIIQRGRPSKEQRKFITRIISDKRDRKNKHTLE